MSDDRTAERSSIEIKTLVRKLHPKRGNHKDRIRQLNKFRNYVIGDRKNAAPPEFYDDDLPLLWLGAAAPSQYLEEVNDDLLAMGIYGLLQACGAPSEDHDGTLKRSARHAMNLLKWIILDWKEQRGGGGTGGGTDGSNAVVKNLFARSFLSLEVKHYHHMQLDLHCIGDDRGGAKEDACQLLVLILTQHTTEDGENSSSLMMEDLLSSAKAQQEFELWTARHCTATTQDAIKKHAAARQAELALQQRQDALATKANDWAGGMDESDHGGGGGGGGRDGADGGADHSDHYQDKDDLSEQSDDEDDVVAAMRKRNKQLRKELKQAEGRGEILSRGVATRWEDSQVAREQRARAASAARARQHETVRDSQQAANEMMEREEERAKVLGKDPLGILKTEDFDLSTYETTQAAHMERALAELQEEMQKAENTANEKTIKKTQGKKESLEGFIERLGGIEAMENTTNLQHSILPTNPKFDPLLFLTLVHRKTKFETLKGSVDRLSSKCFDERFVFLWSPQNSHQLVVGAHSFFAAKTENQVEQLQNLVRDNFPLFVRCAEGFEQFRKSSEDEVGLGLNERIDKLEGIAESCAFQAKKSFKPLLDNTSEVRKVQSAMTVLQRIAPILHVPAIMRQHIENRRYSEALKTYRRVLLVDKSCKIEILNQVRVQAEVCVLDARRALESRLAQELSQVPIDGLLDAIRDLDELLQLTDIPAVANGTSSFTKTPSSKDPKGKGSTGESSEEQGIFDIGGHVISIREHPPALACLLLQAAHMSLGVLSIIDEAENQAQRIFSGEKGGSATEEASSSAETAAEESSRTSRASGNQWKYDILDARVLSTIKTVSFARLWLPRLIRVARAAREDEKRRAARIGLRRHGSGDDNHLTAFEVFLSNIAPSITKLVEHAAFCALGSTTRSSSKDIVLTFGKDAPEKLRALLRSPLPPSQSTKVAKELAALVEILAECADGTLALRPDRDGSIFKISPLEECRILGDAAVLTIEKRRCIYAFDVCSRACANRASGSGKFDAEALLNCLQTLSEQLTRPEECSTEVEKGCELVVRRCCEGLASYVRDRGDDARLNAVSECADVMADQLCDVIAAASKLTPNVSALEDVTSEDVMGLECAMFDEYLENIRSDVASSVRVGWLESDAESISIADGNAAANPTFPPYLSASLLAIVRCRAQVEQALGDKVRVSEGLLYQHLAMATVAEGVVDGICKEIMARKSTLKVRQADRLANELEFLKNTLKKFLGEEVASLLDSTLQVVATRAGRGRNYQGDGPDGLAALEELERLGRVYVLCLGE